MSELYESEDFIYNRIPIRIFNHCFDGIEIFTPTTGIVILNLIL